MLTCRQATQVISEAQDRPLGWRERWSLRLHLMMCVSCRAFERQMRLIRRLLRQQEAEAPVELPEEARQRIQKTLDAHRHGSAPD